MRMYKIEEKKTLADLMEEFIEFKKAQQIGELALRDYEM